MLFGPIENLIDLCFVEDKAVQWKNIANGFIVDGGCIGGCFFSTFLQSEDTVFPVVGCTTLAPEGHGKFPNAVDGGAHPVVRGEGFAGLSVAVIVLYGMFPIASNLATEELVPSNLPLGGKCSFQVRHDWFRRLCPCGGCDACSVQPACHAVTYECHHDVRSFLVGHHRTWLVSSLSCPQSKHRLSICGEKVMQVL